MAWQRGRSPMATRCMTWRCSNQPTNRCWSTALRRCARRSRRRWAGPSVGWNGSSVAADDSRIAGAHPVRDAFLNTEHRTPNPESREKNAAHRMRCCKQQSAGAADHDGLAGNVDHALLFQLLEHATDHFARAADDPAHFLTRDADLGAVRMGHRIGFLTQVEQGARDAVGDVHEGHAADLARGAQQTVGQLRADREQDLRAFLAQRAFHQLEQALVADLGHFARSARAHHRLALGLLHEQAHFADELAATDVGEDQLAPLFVLGADRQRAFDHVIKRVGRVAWADDRGLAGVAAAMALAQEAFHRSRVGSEAQWRLRALEGLLQLVFEVWRHGDSWFRQG